MTDSRSRLQSGQGFLWGLSLAVSLVVNAAVFWAIALAGTFTHASSASPAMASPPERIATVELVMASAETEPVSEVAPVAPEPESKGPSEDLVKAEESAMPVVSQRFARTTADQESDALPVSALFIGERNTRAASDQEATPGEGISQAGTESNFGEVDTVKGGERPEEGAAPAPVAAEIPRDGREIVTGSTPVPVPVANAQAEPAAEPNPVPAPNGEGATARKTSLRGSVTQSNRSAVDVVDSPMGRYHGAILRAVEEEWLKNGERYQKFVTAGYMTVKVSLSSEGKVRSLKVIEAVECTDPQKGYTLSSIRSAKLPPIPSDLKKQLRNGPMPELSITFAFPSLQ
jgi:hypothetical protein